MFSAATPILWLNAVDNNFEYGTAGSAESSLDPEMVLFLAHPEECSPFFQRPSHIANYSVAETGPTLSRSMIHTLLRTLEESASTQSKSSFPRSFHRAYASLSAELDSPDC